MQALIGIAVLVQAAGAIIGAGGSVIGELSYLQAMQDMRVSHAEHEHLTTIARALRWGMLMLLGGSIGLVILDYLAGSQLQPALTNGYWVEMTLAFIVIWASWALSRERVVFWLGSAAAFTGWWSLALLTLGRAPTLGYGASLGLYVIATAIIAAILAYARMLTANV
jgi:hypothetical protein